MTKTTAGRFSWPAALTLVALIIVAAIVFIFIRIESWPARTAKQGTIELEQLGKDLRSAFIDIAHLQPRITINNRVYVEKTIATTELAVVTRRVEVEHEFQNTWAGSSKRVKLHGTFVIKAGFDLRQDLSVDIRPEEILIKIPHAQILGVEQQQLDVLAFENGFWNRISAGDVETELGVLPQLARERAGDLPEQAERSLQEQLDQRIHAPQPVRVIFGVEPKD